MDGIRRLLTQKEYAEKRNCSVRTVERERESGEGCPYVQMGRRIYYRPEDIEQYIAANVRGHVGDDAADSQRRRPAQPPRSPRTTSALPRRRRGRLRKPAADAEATAA
jgi:hypothetical protein